MHAYKKHLKMSEAEEAAAAAVTTPTTDCSICLEPVQLRNGRRPVFSPGCCGALFHLECIVPLCTSGGGQRRLPKCPLCRVPMEAAAAAAELSSNMTVVRRRTDEDEEDEEDEDGDDDEERAPPQRRDTENFRGAAERLSVRFAALDAIEVFNRLGYRCANNMVLWIAPGRRTEVFVEDIWELRARAIMYGMARAARVVRQRDDIMILFDPLTNSVALHPWNCGRCSRPLQLTENSLLCMCGGYIQFHRNYNTEIATPPPPL